MNGTRVKGLAIIANQDTVIDIGPDIQIGVEICGRDKVRVMINAPKEIRVTRNDHKTQRWGKPIKDRC